jgi:hypothetical protein
MNNPTTGNTTPAEAEDLLFNLLKARNKLTWRGGRA